MLVKQQPGVVGPLPDAGRAWDVLSAAEQRSRAVTDELLLLPQTGQWLRQTMLRLQTAAGDFHGAEPPLWVDVGQLHLTAAAAAVRTGMAFSLSVPARFGGVWLPSVGFASLPGITRPWEAVTAHFDGRLLVLGDSPGQVSVAGPPGRPAAHWQPERTVTVYFPSGPRPVVVSDTGPFRLQQDLAPPAALPPPAAQRVAELVQHAVDVLARADPQGGQDVAACIRSLEPLPPAQPFRWRSATMADSMGGLAASLPPQAPGAEPAEAAQFAAVLTHEVQHSKLSALLHMYTLHQPDAERRFYAPWRDDPRPLRGMLHGVYAFTAVARFWRGHLLGGFAAKEETSLVAFEFALRRRQLQRALAQMTVQAGLTSLGERVVDQLAETVDRWEEAAVGDDALQGAERATEDHAVMWRLHHLVPDPGLVADLSQAWLSQAAHDDGVDVQIQRGYPTPQLVPNEDAQDLDARAVLTRMLLFEATGQHLWALDDVGDAVQGARHADLLLLSGDAAAAKDLYAVEIAAPAPHRPADRAGAWAGLRLALPAGGPCDAAVRALTHAPELVRDVYQAVQGAGPRPADPVAVADWLGRRVAV
jgi:HEXXH motif-containing protein